MAFLPWLHPEDDPGDPGACAPPRDECTRGGRGDRLASGVRPEPQVGGAMDTDGSARPLLAVKQQAPPVRDGAVVRRRLVEQIASARTRLVVVGAPPGWGKTSLLSAWARDGDDAQRVAWVSLDERDDEQRRFWRYVLTALN